MLMAQVDGQKVKGTSILRLSSSSSATSAAMASRRTVGTSSSCWATASSMMGPPRLQMEFLRTDKAQA